MLNTSQEFLFYALAATIVKMDKRDGIRFLQKFEARNGKQALLRGELANMGFFE